MAAKRSAILVDFDNIVAKHGQPMVEGLGNWLAWLEDGGFDPKGGARDFLSKRVYWNIHNDTAHRLPFKRRLFETRVCRAVRNKDKGSSADFDITIDATELRHDFKRIQEVIVLSYDSDFLTVLNHLQVFEIDVVGMAHGGERPARAFRELADLVIEFEDFKAAFAYERPKRASWLNLGNAKPAVKAKASTPPPATRTPAKAAPAKTVKPAASKPKAPPAKAPLKAAFDFKAAAALVVKAAALSPSAQLSKVFVTRALKPFEGFSADGRRAWLGCVNYPAMITQLAAADPRLNLYRTQNGGLVLIYKGA